MGRMSGGIPRDGRKTQNGYCARGFGGRGCRNHALRPLQAVLRVGDSDSEIGEVGPGPEDSGTQAKGAGHKNTLAMPPPAGCGTLGPQEKTAESVWGFIFQQHLVSTYYGLGCWEMGLTWLQISRTSVPYIQAMTKPC